MRAVSSAKIRPSVVLPLETLAPWQFNLIYQTLQQIFQLLPSILLLFPCI